MEYRLGCFAFGSYPGRKEEEKSYLGTKLDFSDDEDHIVWLSSSNETLIFVTEAGKSMALGKNTYGNLGIGSKNATNEYVAVKSNELFNKAKAGDYFSFWLDFNDKLYVAGTSKEYLEPTPIDFYKVFSFDIYEKSAILCVSDDSFVFYEDFSQDVLEKKEIIKMPGKIKEISCGNKFCTVLLENELLFKYSLEKGVIPVVVQQNVLDGGNRFISASCSENYIAVIDINGGFWIIGCMGNYNGEKALISLIDDVVRVCAFPTHCIVFDGFGQCYSLGSNKFGELGNKSFDDSFTPMPMDQIDAAFNAVGGKNFTILLPFGFSEENSKYHDEDVIPGSLAKTLQNTANFVPQ